MRKLNQKKIKWIIKQKNEGMSNEEIAFLQKISTRRVKQIYQQYKETKRIPTLKKPGRKRKDIPEKYKELISVTYKEYNVGPVALEKIIQRKYNIHIPHNTIYKYMMERNMIIENPNKKKKRKWVRYEREHSLSLVHTDWCEYKGKHIIAYLDDASRMILSCMEFDKATTENSIIALDKAIRAVEVYGKIEQLLTDRGSQFTANKKDKKGRFKHTFEEYLKEKGIEHILSKVNHPQTNGKMERWFLTYKQHRDRFDNLDEFVYWYNYKKPHMSLNFNKAETPSEAFLRKMRTEVWFGFAKNWF